MKKLLRLLVYWKAALIPPFGALLIWILTSLSSSFLRYYPTMINWLDASQQIYTSPDGNTKIMSVVIWNITYIVQFLERLIVSLNYWLPMEVLINLIAASIVASLGFFIVRVFVKLITLGQL